MKSFVCSLLLGAMLAWMCFVSVLCEFEYEIGYQLGHGNFGQIYQVREKTSKEEFICKIESADSESLTNEAIVYRLLEKQAGFARMHWFGMIDDERRGMVLDILGKSLRSLQMDCDDKFSIKTTVLLAYQMVTRLEQLHKSARYVHRDIKPENFVLGLGNFSRTVYLIDFGESSPFMIKESDTHIRYRESDDFIGTRRYASPNAHLGIDQTRRDDLISLGYILLYFLRGRLPWMGLPITKPEKNSSILMKKQATSIGELTEGLPLEFRQYMEHVMELKFADVPDYSYLRKLFKAYALKHNFKDEKYLYDWEIAKAMRNKDSIF